MTGTAFAFGQENTIVLVNSVFQRYRLGILHIGRFAFGQPHVVRVADLLGAFVCAGAAGDTLGFVDVTRVLDELYMEITRFTFYLFNFAEGSQLNVQMPADLDQFR